MNRREAALAFARRGWHVFPVHTPAPAGGCSCRRRDCVHIGKHPRTRNGLNDATIDLERITEWWTMWPDANIGISCGPSGLVVLDIDPDKGGDDSLDALMERVGKGAFATVTSLTGGGGQHFLYLAGDVPISNVANSASYTGPLGPGIDVRAAGGYIVAPPSLHETGVIYDWEAGYGPDDLEPLLLPRELEQILLPPPIDAGRANRVDTNAILAGVPEGERDWQLFLLAAKLRGADLSRDVAYEIVEKAAANCRPPFPRVEARRKVDSAYRYAPGRTAIEASQEAENRGPTDIMAQRVLLESAIAQGVPPTDWLIEDVLVRGQIHNVYGEPESGKTILALHWIAAVAAQGHRVAFFDEESGLASIAARLAAMGVECADENIYYFPFTGLDLRQFEEALSALDELQPALVVFDSMSDMLAVAGLDENNGIEVTRWFKDVAETLKVRPYSPSVVVIDHITKDAGNTKYSIGSRAKKSKSDVQWFVEKRGPFDRTRTSTVTLWRHKNRPGVLPASVHYTVGGENYRLVVRREAYAGTDISELPDMAQEVLEIIKRWDAPMSNQQILERLPVKADGERYSSKAVQKWCAQLAETGVVEAIGTTRDRMYQIRNSECSSGTVPDQPRENPELPGGDVRSTSPAVPDFRLMDRKERLRELGD